MKYTFLYCIFLLLLFACNNRSNFSVESKCEYFNSKNTQITVKQTENFVVLDFQFKSFKDFQYKIINNDTLCYTQFYFDFMQNGKLIELSKSFSMKELKIRRDSSTMSFAGSWSNIAKHDYYYSLAIPVTAFYSIKAGESEIDLDIYQDYFASKKAVDSMDFKQGQFIKDKKFWAKAKIKINVPEIHKAEINSKGFELVKSEGMDFSLINKGNADLYWEMSHKNQKDIIFRSSTITNSQTYNNPDTYTLYYLSPDEIIYFTVFDYDMLSRDDILGTWNAKISDLYCNKDEVKSFKSEYVSWFNIYVENKGVINKN